MQNLDTLYLVIVLVGAALIAGAVGARAYYGKSRRGDLLLMAGAACMVVFLVGQVAG